MGVSFVLVHGTGHGGWCWRFIAPMLRSAGYEVYAPTLTGIGASSHLLNEIKRISLNTHVKDITNLLFYKDLSDVVLVGHSYGGMVITGVAALEPKRISNLVYLDAYLPFEGENELDLWPSNQKKQYYSDIALGIKCRPPIESSVLGITDPILSKWFQERLTSHPYSTYEDPSPTAPACNKQASESIHRFYIHCIKGPLTSWMKPFADRSRKIQWNVQTIEAGHDVMITHPAKLAQILIQIAKKKDEDK
jgi:pimeloyl-ACP methyl ester carboxylesterase